MTWYANFQARRAAQSVNSVNSVNAATDGDEAAERAAIEAEPALPPLGSPERRRLEREQAATIEGLLTVADRARWII